MSFTGDLRHLPIVDVIQLLHATKKSGTLNVRGRRGNCVLVFSEGYIVSASHALGKVSVGQVLVDLQLLGEEVLGRVVAEKNRSGAAFIALLIEGGHVQKEAAFRGLETLIVLTIVEILTWAGGKFTLEVDRVDIAEDYRYFPEQLKEDFIVGTQNVLMEALRIYDEKKRDGELEDEDGDEDFAPFPAGESTESSTVLSADDLGLSDLDQLEKTIPGVFTSLPDIDPLEAHRNTLREVAAGLSEAEQEELLAFLKKVEEGSGGHPPAQSGGTGRVILFSPDELFRYMLTAACKDSGVFVFATNDEGDLGPIIEQSMGKENSALLILDRPASAAAEENIVALRRRLKETFPRLPVIQLAPLPGYEFTLLAFADGIRTVFPRPLRSERPESFSTDFVQFLDSFRNHLQGFARAQGDKIGQLSRCLAGLREVREPQEAAAAVLQFVAGMFVRSLTLIVGPAELVAERSIGVNPDATRNNHLGFRISMAKPSIFHRVIEDGRLFFGSSDDQVIREHLFAAIGAPLRSTFLLLPMRSRGRTLALTYADFGALEAAPVQVDLLEILAGQAGLALENALLHKKLEKSSRQG
ncbi:MAG: DUF4388 domain-containing protein [Desulfuromonadales bacterium]